MTLISLIGWLGAILFIIAYFLLSTGKLSAKRPTYHLLNVIGGICLVVNASKLDDFPNIVVNIVWALIALFALYRIIWNSKKNSEVE
ncbi:CBU_0592 family membrane protein [Zunongwangia endophytica]|uniref:CBU_0592 family membrane protein n=1 Tax=Zunongwangia endophytica TaxID=1808945 RepID=UPI003F4957EB